MKRRATVEWADDRQAGCLRVGGPTFDHLRQDPYDRACTIFRANDTAIVKGWCGHADASCWRAVCECLAREGFDQMVFERVVGERRHEAEVSLMRFK